MLTKRVIGVRDYSIHVDRVQAEARRGSVGEGLHDDECGGAGGSGSAVNVTLKMGIVHQD